MTSRHNARRQQTKSCSSGVGPHHFCQENCTASDTPLQLRWLRASDAPKVLAAFLSNTDMARQGKVSTITEAECYVNRLIEPESPHEAWAIAVCDVLVGLVCVTVDEANQIGWFWYWMTHEARGHGWMSRAAATIADWALTDGGLERLEMAHRVDNPKSGAIARSAGFVKEGTEREKFLIDGRRIDVDTYGRLRSDPAVPFDAIPMAAGAANAE